MFTHPGRRFAISVNVVLIVVGATQLSTHDDLVLRILALLVIVSGVAATVVQWRTRVRADPAGISGLSPWGRRRRVAWVDVHHLEARGYWRGLGVWTVDGRWIGLMSYGVYDRDARAIVNQLEVFRWESQRALGLT